MPSYQQTARLPQNGGRRRSVLFAAFIVTVLAVLAAPRTSEQEVGNHTVITHDVGQPLFGTLAGG